jgi:hypothetical protein
MQAEHSQPFDTGYEVRLMREGEEIETVNLDQPEEIAEHFGIPDRAGAVKQVCQWADEQGCAQGMALDEVSSLVVEPRE